MKIFDIAFDALSSLGEFIQSFISNWLYIILNKLGYLVIAGGITSFIVAEVELPLNRLSEVIQGIGVGVSSL